MQSGMAKVRSLALAVMVCAGAAASVGASGSVSIPSSAKVMSVPGTGVSIALWTERDGRTSRTMYGVTQDGSTLVRPAEYTIGLQYGPFDPARGVPAVPSHLAAGAGNELYLVQYVVPPLPALQAQVTAAGGVIERYVPQSAQVVRMSPESAAAVAGLPFVRWVGAYHPAYRVSPAVFAVLNGQGSPDAPARYSIETLRAGPGQQQALADLVVSLGGHVDVLTPDQYRMEATLTPAQLLAVVQRNEVNFIDPWMGPGGTDMDIVRQIGGALPTLANAGFTGQGVRGEIFDTEVNPGHQAFQLPQPPIKHSNGWGFSLHGSSCYGICFANWPQVPTATGLNPDNSQGIFFDYRQSTQFSGFQSRLAANIEATDPNGPYRSVFQTSSVGSPRTTVYTTISAETDDYLFQVDYLSCQSQSNAGGTQNSRPQAWAKNMVAVGGVDHQNTLTRFDDTSSGASIGPASDGRTKPELAHFYESIFTTSGNGGTTNFGGTSGATPCTAGHFGLLHQMWHEGVWSGFGGASSVFDSRPPTSTARAIMINTAYRYTWTGVPPVGEPLTPSLNRNWQGWGMAHPGNAYNLRDNTLIVAETDILGPLQSTQYQVTVPQGADNLNITMVYKDPQGNPAVQAQHRVNNVDLKVMNATGATYWGNHGLTSLSVPNPSNISLPGGAADTKNTVENVFIPNPAPGVWTIEVIAAEVIQDGYLNTPLPDVAYSLVVTGIEVTGCYPDCDGDGALTIADFGCFQTRFALNDPYADCNGDGQLNLADFGCFQTKFALGCP